jgi:hypothetical protein
MWLFFQRHISNPMGESLFRIIAFIVLTASRKKGGTAVAVRKDIPHKHVDLLPRVSIEARGMCIPTGNSEVLLAAVCKSEGHAWNDTGITELLSFRQNALLARDLNAKHPFWNNVVSNPSAVHQL